MTAPTYLLDGIWGEISPDGTKIAYSRFSDTDLGADGTGTFQLFVADIDGSNELCLSSSFLTTHCGMASWHPSGEWLVVSREMTVGYDGVHENAHPGKGIFVNLWAVRPDGADWTQLTDYATTRDGSPMHSPIGALQARFNNSGSKLAWTTKIGTDAALPFAYWNVVYTSFDLPGDVPTIDVETDVTPSDGTFFEVWDWSDDGETLVIATDVGSYPLWMNAALLNISTSALTLLTGPNKEWDEQSFLSPDETRVAVTTTRGQDVAYDPIGDWWGTLNNDIWIVDALRFGTNAERLTFFNDPTHAMYFPRADGITVRATANQWLPDGTLLINVVMNDGEDQLHSSAQLWIMQGVTGAQVSKKKQVVLTPTADSMIIDATSSTNYGSNTTVAIGDSTPSASSKYRTAIKFDTSSIGADAYIVSAKLQLYEYSAYDTTGIGPWDAEVYRSLKDWSGAEITWDIRKTGSKWATSGATAEDKDIDPDPIDSISLDGVAETGFVEWSGEGVLDLVRKWVDGTYTNNGLVIAAPSVESIGTTPMAANLFRSSDYAYQEFVPRLVIEYYEEDPDLYPTYSIQDLLAAPRTGFKLRFESISSTGFVTDITSRVTSVDSIWYGERSASVFGWAVSISGHQYDRVLLAVGTRIKMYRSFTIDSVSYDDELLWFEGYIQPGQISADWQTETWSLSFVDILTYLSNRRAPIFALGELNIATNANTTTDSNTVPEAVADENEFIGYPTLEGANAVDGDMGSLWISAKAPTVTAVPVWYGFPTNEIRLSPNEVYNPGFGLDKQFYQWVEVSAPHNYNDAPIRIQTRYGVVEFLDISLGAPFGGSGIDQKARFAILCYDAMRFSELFGSVAHAPVYEWRNSGLNFGFNLDNQGDWFAINGLESEPGGDGAHDWITMYVEDGPAIGDAEYGTLISHDGPPSWEWVNVGLGATVFAEDYFKGWFVQLNRGAGGTQNYNKQRKILRSDATDGSSHTRLWVEDSWRPYDYPRDYRPTDGDSVRVTPYPFANDSGYGNLVWPLGEKTPVPSAGNSNRTSLHLFWRGTGSWEEDESPKPGWSGIPPDASLWSWIDVAPEDMSFALSSPLDDGETDVYLSGTDGLLPAGEVYIGTLGPFEYTDKGTETLTLIDPWEDGFVPQGTSVFQSLSGTAESRWPIKSIRVKRRPIPTENNYNGDPDGIRTIDNIRIFASNLDSPRFPDEENWRQDWISGNQLWGAGPGNTNTTITFNIANIGPTYLGEDGFLRARHYLFGIKSMSDQTNGRINEIDILPPDTVVSGSSTNMTVAGFFKYILTVMGVDPTKVQYGNGSTEPIGSLSTDNSSFLSVLSDLAVRTGQVLWAGPKEDKVRISYNPNWPTSFTMEPFAYLDRTNVRNLILRQFDDRTVSQVIVTTRDSEGNVGYGEYPPLPRDDGEIFVDPVVYHAPAEKAQQIARWKYWDMIAPTVSCATVGPAPWARPGEYRTEVSDWTTSTGVNPNGSYVIKSLEHRPLLGDGQGTPRSFATTLEMKRLINT